MPEDWTEDEAEEGAGDETGERAADGTGGVTADGTRPWSITLYPSATYTLQGAPFCTLKHVSPYTTKTYTPRNLSRPIPS